MWRSCLLGFLFIFGVLYDSDIQAALVLFVSSAFELYILKCKLIILATIPVDRITGIGSDQSIFFPFVKML